MATPRRQPPIRQSPSDQDAALRGKSSTMTYSFAQQIPQVSHHHVASPPPPPQSTSNLDNSSSHFSKNSNLTRNSLNSRPDDSNFPKLISSSSSTSMYKTSDKSTTYSQISRSTISNNTTTTPPSKVWDSTLSNPSSLITRPPRWNNSSRKNVTAAEVVASKSSESTAPIEGFAQSDKHQAEFDLISKLVPTTSAVPRNPGRPLGGGGLRATGSVAAQKNTRTVSNSVLNSPQNLSSLPRKEPMTSRMRSLCSDASKPQLARRVAKPNRITTPPSQVSSDTTNSPVVESNDFKTSNGILDESMDKGQIVEKETNTGVTSEKDTDTQKLLPPPRSSQATGGAPIVPTLRRDSDSFQRSRPMEPPSRRLEEAFRGTGRFESGKNTSSPANRKPTTYQPRRLSVVSPPPSLPNQRKYGNREPNSASHWHGTKSPSTDSVPAVPPPGFESRGSSGTRSGLPPRSKTESDANGVAKPRDKEPPLAPPPNARADALREAISSTRRSSSSPRPPLRRRSSQSESNSEPVVQSAAQKVIASRRTAHGVHQPNETVASKVTPTESITQQKASPSVNDDGRTTVHQTIPNGTTSNSVKTEAKDNHLTISSNPGHTNELTNRNHPPANYVVSEALNERMNDMSLDSLPIVTQPERRASSPSISAESNGYHFDIPQSSSTPVHTDMNQYRTNHGHYQIHSDGISAQHVNGWPNVVNDHSRNRSDSLLGRYVEYNSAEYPAHSQNLGIANGNIPQAVESYPLMQDLLNPAVNTTSTVVHGDRAEDVLPPLPNPEEQARFESVLRQMGWTPADEDEAPQNYIANGLVTPMMQRTTANRHNIQSNNMTQNVRRTGNAVQPQGPYYSHFH